MHPAPEGYPYATEAVVGKVDYRATVVRMPLNIPEVSVTVATISVGVIGPMLRIVLRRWLISFDRR
jgi:hypothetical protein